MFERLMAERPIHRKDPGMSVSFNEENPFYVVLRSFNAQVGSGFQNYIKGQLLTDFFEIQTLLNMNAPIALYREQGSYVSCPQCAHVFPINLDPKEKPDTSTDFTEQNVKPEKKSRHGANVQR